MLKQRIVGIIKQRKWWKSVIPYLVLILLMVFLFLHKANYHIDELLSYQLANRASDISSEDGVIYIPPQSPWLTYLTVQGGEIDFEHVWKNQASDVHPPFYYLILYLICFLFPGKFSIWFAASINIVFALLTLFVVKKLVYELTDSRNMVSVISLFFVLSGGILSSLLFLRMYVMTMFLVSLVTWLFLYTTRFPKLPRRFYVTLILVSYIGALTHYYFIVYLFFLCVVFGIWLLFCKRFLETVMFVFSMGLCGCMAVITFPNMVGHMFSGYRGVESIENLKGSASDYVTRLRSFYQFTNERLLGGVLTYVVLAGIFLWIFSKWTVWENTPKISNGNTIINDGEHHNKKMIKWLLVVIPSICYFLLVSKMAVYIDFRYLSPLHAVFIAWIMSGIFVIGKRILEKRYWIPAAGLLLSIVVVHSWQTCGVGVQDANTEKIRSHAETYASCNCIYIYNERWRFLSSFMEASHYKSVTLYHVNNMEFMADMQCLSDKEMVVCITNDCDSQVILKNIMEVCPSLNAYQEIPSFGYTVNYYLFEDVASDIE